MPSNLGSGTKRSFLLLGLPESTYRLAQEIEQLPELKPQWNSRVDWDEWLIKTDDVEFMLYTF